MEETLYLIDGHAHIFRAYFAIRGGMRSPVTGEPTHAVFGFAGMLLKLLSQLRPHYVVAAIDMAEKTFRDDLYPEYKATRQATPDDLSSQVPRILELLDLFGIPVIGDPRLEADDIIATIVQRILTNPECSHVRIKIVSKDKDLEQLLTDRVTLLDIYNDLTIDPDWLLREKGITPAQVIDVLALTGDTVDNVPGVEGIGPKTAAQLVQQFGSVDGILSHLDQIKGKKRENIEKSREALLLSRELVTLKRDADFPFSLDLARVRPLQLGRILPLFQQLGFNRFQEEAKKLAAGLGESAAGPTLPASAPQPVQHTDDLFESAARRNAPSAESAAPRPADALASTAMPTNAPLELNLTDSAPATLSPSPPATPLIPCHYRVVQTHEALAELLAILESAPMVSIDVQPTGTGRNCRICGLSFSWAPGEAAYIPLLAPPGAVPLDTQETLRFLKEIYENPARPKCGHNLKSDAALLRQSGVTLRGVTFDSMLACGLINPKEPAHKLDHLSLSQLNFQMRCASDFATTEQVPMHEVPLDQMAPFAAEEADVALRLCHHFQPKLESMGLSRLMLEVEAPLTLVLADMEANGILCDPDELARQGALLGERVEELRRQITELAGVTFDLNSTRQLGEVLFDRLGLAPGRKTKTGRSTDIEVLEKLAAEEDARDPRTGVPRLIIEYRQLTKLINTYLDNLRRAIHPDTKRIHSTFHQLLTATGRLASQNPNLQNIPVRTDVGRQVRKAFIAPPGHQLICADYSQIELRFLAHFSQDPALVKAFEENLDIHTAVAAQVFQTPLDQVSREQRDHAKTINFGIIYGVTAFGLARRIPNLDVPAASRLIADYKQRFPGLDRFLQQCVHEARDQGYVRTILGRRRAIPEIESSNANTRSLGERLAINSVIQGSAADLIKLAMVNVQRRIDENRLPVKLLLQIHDELVLESPTTEAPDMARMVAAEMEQAMQLRVPLRAEFGIGPDWLSAK